MKVKNFPFKTPTVTIVEPNRYDTLYDGPVENIHDYLLKYEILRYRVNTAINNTYMEVYY